MHRNEAGMTQAPGLGMPRSIPPSPTQRCRPCGAGSHLGARPAVHPENPRPELSPALPTCTPQGREKDIAFFSTVRSQRGSRGIGFVADERRINVGLTRARCVGSRGLAPAAPLAAYPLQCAPAWRDTPLPPCEPCLASPAPALQGHVDSGGPCGVAADQPPLVCPGLPCPQGRLHVQSRCGCSVTSGCTEAVCRGGWLACCPPKPACWPFTGTLGRCSESSCLHPRVAAAKPFADWVTQLAEGQVQPVAPTAEDTAEWAPQVSCVATAEGVGGGWSSSIGILKPAGGFRTARVSKPGSCLPKPRCSPY